MSSAAPVAPFSFNLFASREVAARATAYWWLSLVSGFCWILLSAIVFRFDYASVTAVAVLFGCVAIAAGVMEVAFAAASKGAWKLLHGLLGVVLAAIGVVAFFTPGGTFVGLAAVFSFYFVLAGAWDLSIALWTRHEHSAWWLQALSGVVELGLGFWAAGYWNRSALLLIAFVGAMALMRGVVQIVFAFRLHELHRALESDEAAPGTATATQA
jgi:uncharacterized membrane protein HdeD (DUF308 family)